MIQHLKSAIPRVLISVGAIGIIIYLMRDKLGDSMLILKTEVDWRWFFAAVAGYLIAQALMALRLYFIFKTQDIHIAYQESLYLVFIGLFFNLFLPSAIGVMVLLMLVSSVMGVI